MNHLMNITRKELKELFTAGTVISVIMVVLLFSFMGQAFSEETESATKPVDIGIVYQSAGPDEILISSASLGDLTYKTLVETAYKATYGNDADLSKIHIMTAPYGDADAIIKEMDKEGCRYCVGIPTALKTNVDDISTSGTVTVLPVYYIYASAGVFGSISSASGEVFVQGMSVVTSEYVVSKQTGLSGPVTLAMENPIMLNDADTYTSINGEVYDGISPYQISSAMMSQTMMIPIIVMIVITIVGSVVISSMGSEKENKTLETLLTMPVRRTTIVSGKLLAAAIMGLFYGVCYLVGMMFYTGGLTSGVATVDLSQYGLGMGVPEWIILFVVLFLAIFTALGLCMILGAFTKNYKMAQTMVMPITVLALIPMLVIMFMDFASLPTVLKGVMFAIPFTHPMMAMTNLMMGDMTLVLAGMVYLAVLDLVLVLITVRIYNSDILITGLDRKGLSKKLGLSEVREGKR